jgi:hypothetical protein
MFIPFRKQHQLLLLLLFYSTATLLNPTCCLVHAQQQQQSSPPNTILDDDSIIDGVSITAEPLLNNSNEEYVKRDLTAAASAGLDTGSSVFEDALLNSNNNDNNQNNLPPSASPNVETNDSEHHNKHSFAPHRHHNKHGNSSSSPYPDDLVVNTQSGLVRGKAYYLDHHLPRTSRPRNYPFGRKKYRVNGWTGIPYAEKPIGDLRFKRPVPIKNWEGVYNATELPNSCHQLPDTVISDFWGVDMWNANTPMSEDCLYLNVWTPHPKPRNSPVMV